MAVRNRALNLSASTTDPHLVTTPKRELFSRFSKQELVPKSPKRVGLSGSVIEASAGTQAIASGTTRQRNHEQANAMPPEMQLVAEVEEAWQLRVSMNAGTLHTKDAEC